MNTTEALKAVIDAMTEARHTLEFASDNPGGPINDTIWMMHSPETLFDFMDAAIEAGRSALAQQEQQAPAQTGEKTK